MIKRLSAFLILTIFSWLLFSSTAFAQEFSFSQAYEDYLYNYNQYRAAHTQFVAAQQQYLTYKTLTAKAEALEKTKTMLTARDEALRTYLIALRLNLKETPGVSAYEKNIVSLRLNNEINWYETHQARLSAVGSISDSIQISDEAQDHHPETEVSAYQALGTIIAGEENSLRDKIQSQIDQLEIKIAQIRQEGKMETRLFERWLLEAQNRLTWSKEKQFSAQSLLAELKLRERNKGKVYSQAQQSFNESRQYLKEATSFLLEIIREVGID